MQVPETGGKKQRRIQILHMGRGETSEDKREGKTPALEIPAERTSPLSQVGDVGGLAKAQCAEEAPLACRVLHLLQGFDSCNPPTKVVRVAWMAQVGTSAGDDLTIINPGPGPESRRGMQYNNYPKEGTPRRILPGARSGVMAGERRGGKRERFGKARCRLYRYRYPSK